MNHTDLLDLTQRGKTAQICSGVRRAILDGVLPPGSKLPSIRQLATAMGASPFTVSEAYARLQQEGWLQSRAGAGFYAQRRGSNHHGQLRQQLGQLPLDGDWLLTGIYNQPAQGLLAGCGWLPPDYYDSEAHARAMRKVAREHWPALTYGHPRGLPALRDWLAERLQGMGLPCDRDAVLLTQGATQALNIVCDALNLAGQPVLVDHPGYCNLLSALRLRGCQLLGVPWNSDGPDLPALETLLQQHRPRIFFTNPWQQNPTGASYAPAVAHGVLRLAQQYDVLIVEDNVAADLLENPAPTLAAMDGLQRVIHIGSFSKALSPALRVGHLLAPQRWQDPFTRTKMLTALTSCSHSERLALALVSDSKYPRLRLRLIDRVARHAAQASTLLETHGWQVFQPAARGMFLWACPPPCRHISLQQAREQGILLAAGKLFTADGSDSRYFRFNAAYLDDPRFRQWLAAC